MRFTSIAIALSALTSTVLGNALDSRADLTGDTCADLDFILKVPVLGKILTIGHIEACVCLSNLHGFCGSNLITIAASALIGKDKVEDIITSNFNTNHPQPCKYPAHAVPSCKKGSPCYFTCKDGFTASPAGDKPTSCVCKKPYVDCNGKCGHYPSCSSGHAKRDALSAWGREPKCAHGLSVCGIFGGRAKSWECVDAQSDLESCGGCTTPFGRGKADGVDCTAIQGVSDVSCIRGGCVVHRCDAGYDIDEGRSSCLYNESKDPVLLAAEYGLEHVPLGSNFD